MFETSEPITHILYDEMSTLVLSADVTSEAIGDKSGKELCEVDLDKKENWLREVKIGEAE